MLATGQTCLVCHSPLTFAEASAGKLCSQSLCRVKKLTTPEKWFCQFCGRLLTVHQVGNRTCSEPGCERQYTQQRTSEEAARNRARIEATRNQAATLRDAAGVADSKSYPLMIVPTNTSPLGVLPEERRNTFLHRLREILDEMAAASADSGYPPAAVPFPVPAVPDPHGLLGQGCARCRGACCRTGRDHAYVCEATLGRYRNANPGLTADEVVQAYMDLMPVETIENGCVFQGIRGCTLPREMRSDICNGFFCYGLRGYIQNVGDDPPARAFIASESVDGRILAAAFVDEGGLLEVAVAESPTA